MRLLIRFTRTPHSARGFAKPYWQSKAARYIFHPNGRLPAQDKQFQKVKRVRQTSCNVRSLPDSFYLLEQRKNVPTTLWLSTDLDHQWTKSMSHSGSHR